MKVHHISGATLHPAFPNLVFERGRQEALRHMVCHVLVIETGAGLVLVDSGFGTGDLAEYDRRYGLFFRGILKPERDPSHTVLGQLTARGLDPKDVRHIVLTHMDLDHAGGLPDFPNAAVHVHARELEAARTPKTFGEKERYQPLHWAHDPTFHTYTAEGEPWNGFDCVRQLEGLPPEVLLVPLFGHTRGHCAVAVDSEDGWLMHCGDAYFHHEEVEAHGHCTTGLSLFQTVAQVDGKIRRENQARLRALHAERPEVALFSAHDAMDLARFGSDA